MTSIDLSADEESVRRRAVDMASRLFRRVRQSTWWSLIIGVTGLIAGVLLARSGMPAAAIVVAVGAIVLEVAPWAWLRHADDRAALELLFDHDRRERSEWKLRTGTKLPRGVKASRAWLEAHPDGPGRASILLQLGRLKEAKEVIVAMVPSTPGEALARDILSATIALYAGGRPPVADLHSAWRMLPDSVERTHRRECIALLDAQIAAAGGEPGWPILSAARREITLIARGSQTWRLALRWLRINLVGVLLPVVFAAVVVF